ncbi:MAG: LIC_13355 family lipoprotein [Myxococcales bacterium]|nr:LIC_13355 family lipoprotein [Myxococcales bacterium]
MVPVIALSNPTPAMTPRTSARLLYSIALAAITAWGAIACQADDSTAHQDARFADIVIAAPGANDGRYGDPQFATDGVHGAGERAGNADDVFTMGHREPLTLSWSERSVCNGAGVDFVIFENAFRIGDAQQHFMEQAAVALSNDGENFIVFPHDYTAPDETLYSDDPSHWQGFAGVQPVLFNADTHRVDPFDADLAGGDAFDLDDLPDDGALGTEIRRHGFRYLRLIPASALTNPDTGQPFPKDPMSNGPDIDGVAAQWLAPAGTCTSAP